MALQKPIARRAGEDRKILIDDNEKVRNGWHLGETIDATNPDWLDELEALIQGLGRENMEEFSYSFALATLDWLVHYNGLYFLLLGLYKFFEKF